MRFVFFILFLLFNISLINDVSAQDIIKSKKAKQKKIPITTIPKVWDVEDINFSSYLGDSLNLDVYTQDDRIEYGNRIIHNKIFFDTERKKVKKEFYRVDSMLFMFREYDSNYNKLAEGLLRLAPKPFYHKSDTTAVDDINGNTIKYEVRNYLMLQLEKTGFWQELFDTNYSYQGCFLNNKREGCWLEIRKSKNLYARTIERIFDYHNGEIDKIDTINTLMYNKPVREELFCNYWKIDSPNFEYKFNEYALVKADSTDKYPKFALSFSKDGTYYRGSQGGHYNKAFSGNWKIVNNKVFVKDEQWDFYFIIKHLSDENLVIEVKQ